MAREIDPIRWEVALDNGVHAVVVARVDDGVAEDDDPRNHRAGLVRPVRGPSLTGEEAREEKMSEKEMELHSLCCCCFFRLQLQHKIIYI